MSFTQIAIGIAVAVLVIWNVISNSRSPSQPSNDWMSAGDDSTHPQKHGLNTLNIDASTPLFDDNLHND